MLGLTRRIGEVIVINDTISIKILDLSGAKAKLGITAPTEVPISRPDPERRTIARWRNGRVLGELGRQR